MDLANLRQNGMRSIDAWCLDCHHKAAVNVDDQPAHLTVKSFERRMRRGRCGSRRVDVRPAWHTRPTALPFNAS
jgi:hypothetical protein